MPALPAECASTSGYLQLYNLTLTKVIFFFLYCPLRISRIPGYFFVHHGGMRGQILLFFQNFKALKNPLYL
jgi:hypothetical protein